jgi:circadian clock protein KaiC
MLGGKGYYRGSSILVSGQAGTGKTSLAATFIDAACRRGEKGLFIVFEESESQLTRNMKSIGINLEPWVKKGLLKFHAVRPTAYSLEMHLAIMVKLIAEFGPKVIAIDPISNLYPVGDDIQVRSMLMRMIDHAKTLQITALFTNLSSDEAASAYALETTHMHVSSLMDTWLILKNVEGNGERNRAFSIAKARGLAHSNQIREFVLTGKGIQLVDIYKGSDQVLFGTARIAQETREVAGRVIRNEEIERRQRELDRKRRMMENEIAILKEKFSRDEDEIRILIEQDVSREKAGSASERAISAQRGTER